MVRGIVDTSEMKQIGPREPRHSSKDEWTELYLDRIVESDKRITKYFVRANFMRAWNEATCNTNAKPTLSHYRYAETKQKFLCVGGILDGKMVAEPGEDYLAFNNSYREDRRHSKEQRHKVIYVFKDLLREAEV